MKKATEAQQRRYRQLAGEMGEAYLAMRELAARHEAAEQRLRDYLEETSDVDDFGEVDAAAWHWRASLGVCTADERFRRRPDHYEDFMAYTAAAAGESDPS